MRNLYFIFISKCNLNFMVVVLPYYSILMDVCNFADLKHLFSTV